VRKPHYDLAASQRAAFIQIPQGSAVRANHVLRGDITLAEQYIRRLFMELRPEDFAHVETMRPRAGRVIIGDVYAKQDAAALWFIKFRFDGQTTTVILSCHEAEHPIELADGRTLRGPKT